MSTPLLNPWEFVRWVDVPDFSGGLNDTSDTFTMAPNQARTVRNMHWRRRRLEKRRGSFQVGQTLPGPTNWVGEFIDVEAGTRKEMQISDDKLYEYDTGTSMWIGAVSGLAVATAADVCCDGSVVCGVQQYKNILWIMDGIVAKRWIPGVPRIEDWSWDFVSAMPAPVLNAVVAGGNLTGPGEQYNMYYVYFDPVSGEQTNPSPLAAAPLTTVTASDRIDYTIPADPNWTPNFSEIHVYRNKAGGVGTESYFFEHKYTGITNHDVAAINSTDVGPPAGQYLTDLDSSLGDLLDFDNDVVVPGRNILLFDESFVVWGFPTEESTIRYSKTGNPAAFPELNNVIIRERDGTRVVNCMTAFHQIFVAKERTAFLMARDPQGLLAAEEIPQHWGGAAERAQSSIDTFLFGLDHKGPWRFDTNHFSPQHGFIQNFMDSVRESCSIQESHSVAPKNAFADFLYLWVKTDEAHTDPQDILVMDSRTGGWMVWNDLPARVSSVVHTEKGRARVWAGTSDGIVYILEEDYDQNVVWQDYDGSAVIAEWESGPLGLAADDTGLVRDKHYAFCRMSFEKHDPTKLVTIDLEVRRDRDDLAGAAFSTMQYTPHGTGNDIKTARLWMSRPAVARYITLKIIADEMDQDFILSHIGIGITPFSGDRVIPTRQT